LDSFGIAVRSGQHCTGPLMEKLKIPASVRASFYFYNTHEEIDLLVSKISEVLKVFEE
jgi:cysteine desulfurase/selenocysteine lyase